METPTICHNYRIYHKNRIYMHAPTCMNVVQLLGGVLCYLYEPLHYFYELFTPFVQKIGTTIMACIPRGVGVGPGV
jgi:hypothetical protein